MRSPSKILGIAAVVLGLSISGATGLAGCGGSSDEPAGPLSKRFDDMYIAVVPLEQKESVVQSQNEWSRARMEYGTSSAHLRDSTAQLSIVRNDLKAAQLSVESAAANKKAADESANTARVNEAAARTHAAEALFKAANARVKYFEAYDAYIRAQQRATEDAMYWREAQYEAAKAAVGQKNGIAPSGVSYDAFPAQETERRERAESSKERADERKKTAQSARESWLKAQESSDRENGRAQGLSDPMARSGS